MSSEQWVSSAELARRCNVSRNGVKKAIQEHRINPSDVRRVGRSVMVRLSAGMATLGYRTPAPAAPTAPTTGTTTATPSLFAWGSTAAPEPEPAPAPPPPPEPEPVPDDAATVAEWASAYAVLRKWLMHGATTGFSGAMWHRLGEQPAIGDVMVAATELIGAQLAQLDRLATEQACRMRPNEWRTWR